MKCSRCGYENPAGAGFCSECEAPLVTGTADQQNNYGQTNYAQPNQPNYGQPNYAQPNQPNYAQPMYAQSYGPISRFNRWIAFALCFFLGAIGVHRFYVGKVGAGILYIFTGGLFTIGVLVDLIMIACGSFTDQYGAVLQE